MEKLDDTAFNEKFNQYLNEKNYIAAYSNLKEAGLGKQERNEKAGIIVNDILKDLDSPADKPNSETTKVLRSILLWIFRDYPGLAQVYKTQIRSGNNQNRGLFSLLGDLSNPDTAKERVSEEMDNLMDNVKQNLDDTAEDLKSGRAQEKVKDFIDQAEINIREGIKNLADIFDSINKNDQN